jgi:hypothetical protein
MVFGVHCVLAVRASRRGATGLRSLCAGE